MDRVADWNRTVGLVKGAIASAIAATSIEAEEPYVAKDEVPRVSFEWQNAHGVTVRVIMLIEGVWGFSAMYVDSIELFSSFIDEDGRWKSRDSKSVDFYVPSSEVLAAELCRLIPLGNQITQEEVLANPAPEYDLPALLEWVERAL
jgi:hypothetical protein